ncbi:NADH dehydrogenase subunit 3 (mitochondrion) [Neurospora crassa OR74A]|uniref:NADH-ubiquinone oxidoreductase chain 3 n=2 Tax=Neurospora crassa TaxID=5141 RepID=NU3M_NEUCR|nr:NADH dehydrogenase subunit 3 [Neurospora crassa OR74A]Q35141.2 RecName: Full=NADH-ubiquinone oxidoreductase chain 3; AltName: Full=NADH dehydrogenase subunit 3 [Neurospora crassa OR74A]ARI43924.1 NADH dehydrogenase subunit 3 [Neurospora crassa]AGG15996.1 NADH dehydrogenase subunit 3 [Neurospora crassa OR74A]ARK14986.1 NADH dehydrogenase subunit 3 [Neurospora crassa]ARK15001.1 NADH dehydrogenase subunit 3 [Neurospora crassa]QUB01631.1 NADH dehydrogenase subunit 3 [Neurospora crassa]|eukprot:YP_009126708.1 NADH dehydrogenase subunit 3 (mitochondrion) [Neurospora crassa OR74A]
MRSMTLFILFVSIIALLFLLINLVFAPHIPYQEKNSEFECGFHSFHQTRFPFDSPIAAQAICFVILDLEIFTMFPYVGSLGINTFYSLVVILGFMFVVSAGFVFELGKGALKIDSKQNMGGDSTHLELKNLKDISSLNLCPPSAFKN